MTSIVATVGRWLRARCMEAACARASRTPHHPCVHERCGPTCVARCPRGHRKAVPAVTCAHRARRRVRPAAWLRRLAASRRARPIRPGPSSEPAVRRGPCLILSRGRRISLRGTVRGQPPRTSELGRPRHEADSGGPKLDDRDAATDHAARPGLRARGRAAGHAHRRRRRQAHGADPGREAIRPSACASTSTAAAAAATATA